MNISDHTSGQDCRTALAEADPTTWAAVVTSYHGLLVHVARRQRLNDAETADMVQETWTRLFQHAREIREPERLAGWIRSTATRECIATRKRGWREGPVRQAVTDQIQEWDVDDRLHAEHRAAALRNAVARLPQRERCLMEALLEPEQVSYTELSTRLGMPVGSIGPVRGRALARLRVLLDSLDADDLAKPRAYV